MKVRTNLLLPRDLVARVDVLAGPRGRSRYIAQAVEAQLRRDRLVEVARDTAGVWSAEEYPEFSTAEKVVEWVRARRAEVTDPGLEDADAIDARHDVRHRPVARRPAGNRSLRTPGRGR